MMKGTGFTLIELLLYVLFVGGLLLSAVLLANTVLTTRGFIRTGTILDANARFAMGRIRSRVTEAVDILSPSLNVATSTLVLSTGTTSTNPTVISEARGVIVLMQGTGTAVTLTSSDVDVTQLSFMRVSSTIPAVRILLSAKLRDVTGAYQHTLTVTTSAVLRR